MDLEKKIKRKILNDERLGWKEEKKKYIKNSKRKIK